MRCATSDEHLPSLQPEEGYAAYALASLTLPACRGAFLAKPEPQRDHPFATAAACLSPEQLWRRSRGRFEGMEYISIIRVHRNRKNRL